MLPRSKRFLFHQQRQRARFLPKKKIPWGSPESRISSWGANLHPGYLAMGLPSQTQKKKPENQSSPRVKRWVRICWLHQNTIIETKQRFSARKEGRFGRICLGTIFKSNWKVLDIRIFSDFFRWNQVQTFETTTNMLERSRCFFVTGETKLRLKPICKDTEAILAWYLHLLSAGTGWNSRILLGKGLKTNMESRWFNSWPFYPVVGGHQQPLKGLTIPKRSPAELVGSYIFIPAPFFPASWICVFTPSDEPIES